MAGITPAQASAILKTRFSPDQVKFVGYEGHALLAMLPKMEDFTGEAMKVPIHWGGHTGDSSSFANAQANQGRGRYDAFLLTRKSKYHFTTVDMESYEAAASAGPGAFLNLLESETQGMIRQLGNVLSRSVYRNFGGAKGQVGSTSTTTLTLKNVNDIVNFEVGDVIVSDDTDGTAGGAADAETATITAIDRDAGTITRSDANWTTGGNFSNNDYLFNQGDFGAALSGIDSWLPTTAPGATAFFGVDRSVDPTRLGGVRVDASSMSIEEGLQFAEIRLMREGGRPTHCFMNPKDFGDLRASLSSRVMYDRVQSSVAGLSFSAIVLSGANDIRIMADRDCPQGKAYLLTLGDFKLYSLGAAPRFNDAPGLGHSLIVYNADQVEFRGVYRAQLGCRAPGHSAVVTLPAVA